MSFRKRSISSLLLLLLIIDYSIDRRRKNTSTVSVGKKLAMFVTKFSTTKSFVKGFKQKVKMVETRIKSKKEEDTVDKGGGGGRYH